VKRKVILTIASVLLLGFSAFIFAGCDESGSGGGGGGAPAANNNQGAGAGTSTGSGSVNVGIVLPTKEEPRWLQDEAKFKEVIGTTEYTAEVMFSGGRSDTEKQNVEVLVGKGIDVLIICPHDATAAAAAVDVAKKAGVTVIAYDRLVPETDALDYYVTFDSVSVGEAQAQYLVDQATGTGNPLYLYAGAASDNNAFLFFEGSWNVLQPKIADGTFVIKNSSEAVNLQDKAQLSREEMSKIIGQISTNWDFGIAKTLAEANMTAVSAEDKGHVFALAPNDGTARAIADTFAVNVDSYVITGQDSEIESVQYIIDGKQSMTVFKDTRSLASDAMNMAVSVLKGEAVDATASYNNGMMDVPAKQSPIISVDINNLVSVLIDSGYFSADLFTGLN